MPLPPPTAPARTTATAAAYRSGPLAPYLAGPAIAEAGDARPLAATSGADHATLFAGYRLQDISDYRTALQGWFADIRIGGHLIVVVPHTFLFDRAAALPSRWNPGQRRLYTPASLLEEVEEALLPNSYRVRWLGDLDDGYDYHAPPQRPPVGRHDVALVLEKRAPPVWLLDAAAMAEADAPDFAFEPPVTRIEGRAHRPHGRILLLKLDHLGDFIMALPAFEKLRRAFPNAHITLVAGPWNVDMARDLALFDEIIAFDAFPRNATEDPVDVAGKAALLQAAVPHMYDLAIDLRTDPDTRFLLTHIHAGLRAGLGSRTRFPFLDIFLPIDGTRHDRESARIDDISLRDFACDAGCVRTPHQIAWPRDGRRNGNIILWGPYREVQRGHYLFQPQIDFDSGTPGLLTWDIKVGPDIVARGVATESLPPIAFSVNTDGGQMEFRLRADRKAPLPGFQFFGGRLIRQGAASVLHQSEYLLLLVELVSLRLTQYGVFGGRTVPA